MTFLRHTAHPLLLLAVVAVTAPAQAVPDAVSNDACTGSWSSPVGVERPGGLPVYVEPGLITPIGERSLVLGTPTFFWMGRDHIWPAALRSDTAGSRWAVTRAGALVDSLGSATALPPVDNSSRRGRPVLVAPSPGGATVAWEAMDPSVDDPVGTPTRVEISTFDGAGWSTPEVVLRAQRLKLDVPPSRRGAADHGRLLLAAATRDSAGPALALVQRRGAAWSVALWRGATFVHHASAAPAADGSVTIVMMAWLPHEEQSGVYAMRAGTTGGTVTWTRPRLIATIEGRFGGFTWARLGGDSLLVAWAHRASAGAPDELRSAVSADAGQSWIMAPPLEDAVGVDSEQILVDTTGGVHLIFRGASVGGVLNAPGRIMHARWRDGRWTKPVAIATAESLTGPAAGTAPGGRLVAMWTAADVVEEGLMPRSLVSFWSPGCRGSRAVGKR